MEHYRSLSGAAVQWLDVPKGTLAFMNSHFNGLVPCKLTYLRRVTHADGRVEYWADCVFTATRGIYRRGDREARDLSAFVPRSAVHKSRQRPGHFAIWAYRWGDFIPALADTAAA